MNTKTISTAFILFTMLAVSACGSVPASPAPEVTLPAVINSSGIVAEGRVEPVRYVDIALNVSGLVSEVLSVEGDQVKAGQVIARLENSQAQTLEAARANAFQELTSAYEAVCDAQFELDNFYVPTGFSDLTPTEAVSQTLDSLNITRAAYEPHKNYVANNADRIGHKQQLDEAWSDYRKAIQWLDLTSTLETAQVRLGQALKDYDELMNPSSIENTAVTRAALANAEIRALFTGTITSLNLKVGEFVLMGQPVITLADLSKWVVKTTDLTEIDVVNIKEGQPVEVTLDAIPGKILKGNVLFVSPRFSEKQGDIVYEVTILLTDVTQP